MGMFDNSSFQAPDFNMGSNPGQLRDFLSYKDLQDQKQQQYQKDLMNFQSNLKLNELSKSMAMQRANMPPPEPKQVVYNPLIDPYHQGLLQQGGDKLAQGQEKIAQDKKAEEDRNKIAQQNLNIKADEAKDENLVQMKTQGGQVYYIDRKSGKIVNTGIDQGTLTGSQQFSNKQTLQQEGETAKSNLETQRQGNRVTNLNIRGGQSTANIAARGAQDRLTRNQPNPNGAANLPSQQIIREKLAAQDFVNKNPNLGKFVTIDPNTGLVNVTPPSSGSSIFSFGNSGPSQDEYHHILDSLYGQRTSVSDRPDSSTTTVTAPNPANNTKVRVTDRNGNPGTWDTTKGPVPNGFTVIK